MSDKSKDDVEKAQDGKESEAEIIVNANKDIKIAAKNCFDKLEQLLGKSTAEVENMHLDVEDVEVTFNRIASQMEICERKRQSFAILSCHVTKCDAMLSMNLLLHCKDVNQKLSKQLPSTATLTSLTCALQTNGALGEQICASNEGMTSNIHTDGTKELKMPKNAFLRKIGGVRQLPPTPTTQSSTQDDNGTLMSEELSSRQTTNKNDHTKKAHEAKKPASNASSGNLQNLGVDKNKTRNIEKEKKQKKEKNKNEGKPINAFSSENKRKWWHFW